VVTLLAAVCAAAATALAGAAGADAAKAPQKPPKQALFKATLSGSQVTTWEYHHARDEDDPCDQSVDGYGDQTISFDAGKPFNLRFIKPTKAQPNAFLTGGRPVVALENPRLLVSARAERNGETRYGGIDHGRCPGDNGGGVIDRDGDQPDCGERTGRFGINLYFHENGAALSDDEALLLPSGLPEKDHLKLSSTFDLLWIGADGEGYSNLGSSYLRCPLDVGAYIPQAGELYTSAQKIPERRLFQKGRRKIVISGSHIAQHRNGESTGQTILAWNLRLTRVK
jgi:hypothetical protein